MIRKSSLKFLLLLPLLFSCQMEIPEKISIKTNASYAFTIGDFSKNLSEYLSIESIKDKMGEGSVGSLNYEVYDYNPESSSEIQQYLVEIPFQEIPVDISSYMDKVKFSDEGNSISVSQNITVPDIGKRSEKSTVAFPDISSKFAGKTNTLADLPIPEGNIAVGDNLFLNVNISDPAFTTASFYEGKINLTLTLKSGAITPGYSTTYEFKLVSGNETIDTASGVDLSSGSETVSFNLAGKTIKDTLTIKISGEASGGTLGKTNTFACKAGFSSDVKLKSLTGFNAEYEADDINQTINIETDETFVKCTIDSGYIEMSSVAPTGWKGVTAQLSNTDFSGALSTPAEFKDIKKTTDLFRRKLDLAGAEYSKGNISFTGKVTFKLENATLLFNESSGLSIDVATECCIEKIESIEVDLTSKMENLSYSKSTAFPDDVKKYVKEMVLVNSGLEIKYTNTFPKCSANDENAITVVAKSNLLNIEETKKVLYPEKYNVQEKILSPADTSIPVNPATDEIDFDIKLKLPTAAGLAANHAILKGVSLNETYTISIEAKPVFDWVSVKLLTDSIAQSGSFETGLSFDSLFSGLKSNLGTETGFVDNMKIVSLPIYINCSKPELAGLADAKFSGTVTMLGGTGYTESVQLIKAEQEIKFSEKETLELDKAGTVISKLNANDSNKADLADLLNLDKSVPLKLEYNLALGGLDGVVEITKEEFESLKAAGDAPTAISVTGRLVLPLEVALDAPDAEGNETTMDILALSGHTAGEDLFNRSEGNSLDDIEKYINLIEYSNIIYEIDNGLFRYNTPGKYGKVVFVNSDPEAKVQEYNLSMEGGSETVYTEDIKCMLKNYPFDPTVKAVLPDGVLSIPRNAEFRVNLSLVVKTLGKVTIFGDED